MPRRKSSERKIGKHTQAQIETAFQLIQGGSSIRQAAKEIGVSFTTLQRYNERRRAAEPNVQLRLIPNYAVNKVFSDQQEEVLKTYYKKCALLFYGLSSKDCRQVAYQMAMINNLKIPPNWEAGKLAGVDWFRCFRQRHPDLSLRKPEACSLARATGFNEETVKTFFDNLEKVIQRSPAFVDGTRIYNLDETGTTTVQKPQRVIGPRGHKNLCKVTSGEKGTLCTTCCIISAGGQALPPAIIFPRKKVNNRMTLGTPPGTLILATSSGWMTSELFVEVMEHFIKHSHSTPDNPSILIMDNHESHLSIEALDLAKKSGVTVLTLHPHTSARMQPLDVGVFGPFKSYYHNAMDSWLMRHPGCPVTIYDVGELIGIAFTKSMTISNITKAFQKTGICPFDRDIFSSDDFLPSTVTDRPIPASLIPVQSNIGAGNMVSHDDTVSGPSNCNSNFVSPEQFRAPLKAKPRTNKRKPRKLGKSIIATDTPEKKEIATAREATKRRKETKEKKVKRQVLQSDSEEDYDERVLCQDSDSDNDWFEEDEMEVEENVLTEERLEKPLARQAEQEEFVLVLFCTKRQKVFYIAKILDTLNHNMEYYVSFLRLKFKSQQQFCMPDVPDLAFVKEEDVRFILPNPTISGTARRHSYYKFSVDLSLLKMC